MSGSTSLPRMRADFVVYLERQLAAENDKAIASILRGLFEEAQRFERNASMLGTLARTVEACNAIESGEAAKLANNLGIEKQRLRQGVNKITSVSIEAYVKIRRILENGQGEWTGPHAVTIRKSRSLGNYIKARADRSKHHTMPRESSRDRRLHEVIDKLPAEQRNDLRFALEEGRRAAREVQLMRNAIKNLFPAFDLAELTKGHIIRPTPESGRAIANDDLRILKKLVKRLMSPTELVQFGLTTDGLRVKMSAGAGSRLIERNEMEVLQRLAGMLTSPGFTK